MPKKPEILEIKTLAQSKLFCIEGMHLRFSNGEERHFERLRPGGRGAVMIAAMQDPDTILLVKEYCAGVEDYTLGLPKGLIEKGEDLEEAANRELMEEVGYGANKFTLMASLSLAPQYMSHTMHLLLAEDLYEQSYPGDEPEPIEVVPWSLSNFEELMERQDFSEARSIAAMYMVRDKMRANKYV